MQSCFYRMGRCVGTTQPMDPEPGSVDVRVPVRLKLVKGSKTENPPNNSPQSPERKSGSKSQPKTVYCLCRGPAGRGMVGCDYCDEWYHAGVINNPLFFSILVPFYTLAISAKMHFKKVVLKLQLNVITDE